LPSRASTKAADVSNAIWLTGWQWIGVGLFSIAVVLFTPFLWKHWETLDIEPDYRISHDLNNDYWLYERFTQLASRQYDTVLIGDSFIWGEYVTPQQTLSHYLNQEAGQERFENLGLDGAHPLALAGLVKHYARAVSGKNVILFCNLLWLSSPRADLQDPDASVNHPRLVPQFSPRIPGYREEISAKLGVLVEQRVPFNSWANHLQQVYYDQTDIPSWTMDHWTTEHPEDNPLRPLSRGLPPLDNSLRHPPKPGVPPQPWYQSGIPKQDYPWVDLETSLQWRAFQEVVDVLQRRDNRVFVLVGPFNEHLLSEKSHPAYQKLKSAIEAWLRDRQVAYSIPPVLPSELYGDASHPLAEGYAILARQIIRRLP
jgi:hypothetical protein